MFEKRTQTTVAKHLLCGCHLWKLMFNIYCSKGQKFLMFRRNANQHISFDKTSRNENKSSV